MYEIKSVAILQDARQARADARVDKPLALRRQIALVSATPLLPPRIPLDRLYLWIMGVANPLLKFCELELLLVEHSSVTGRAKWRLPIDRLDL
jgi:hypothetical protein